MLGFAADEHALTGELAHVLVELRAADVEVDAARGEVVLAQADTEAEGDRPPLARSRLSDCLARIPALRSGLTRRLVTSSTRSVTAAARERATSGS